MTSHYLHIAGEAILAGVVAFGITYQASNDLKTSIIAGVMAALTKAVPSSVSSVPPVTMK